MDLARLVVEPQDQLFVLPLHQVGVSLARLNKTGSSYGQQELNLRVWILPLLQVGQNQLYVYCDSLLNKNVECVGYNFNLILYAQGESVRETETEQARVLVGGS